MTDRSTTMPAVFAAQAVAMSARCNSLSAMAVHDLCSKAEELLPRGDDLRCAVLSFATMYEVHRRDEYALRLLGEQLEAAVHVHLHPQSRPAPFRRDIDG